MAEQPPAVRAGVVPHQGHARPVLWWARDFPGGTDQARQARHWIADLLPQCDPLDDLLLLAGELCANAVVHTRSGEPGGRFSVAVEWTPEAARIVIGDQGWPESTAISAKAGGTAWTQESGRGLWLVDQLADDWGTATHCAGRVVWADVRWQASGGPHMEAPGGLDAAIADITATRRAFPGTTIWWGHLTQAWWADHPSTSGLISSPAPSGLRKLLADAYLGFQHTTVGRRSSPPPDLQTRQPGGSLPEPVREAAVQAGRRRRPIDPLLLQRVQDALARLPEHVTTRHYFAGQDRRS
jgi:serine/threonine-protein kinase RsbW